MEVLTLEQLPMELQEAVQAEISKYESWMLVDVKNVRFIGADEGNTLIQAIINVDDQAVTEIVFNKGVDENMLGRGVTRVDTVKLFPALNLTICDLFDRDKEYLITNHLPFKVEQLNLYKAKINKEPAELTMAEWHRIGQSMGWIK